jgi:glutathione S-transferase
MVIQDSVEIFDYLEARHPEIPGLPPGPRQRLAVHLLELLGSEGLVRLAWQYRWFFEGNDHFVKMDFGRSFRPQGTDDELMHYGTLIAERMLSRGALNNSEEVRAELKQAYVALLETLEAHFQQYPYLLGGHPSNADYSLMGALHAHMGRDPVPLNVLQNHAPRVFRWVEHMLVPEIQSPEFYDTPIEYPADDALPDTLLDVLRHLCDHYAEPFSRGALAWAEHAHRMQNEPAGKELSEPGEQPQLPPVSIEWQGRTEELACNLYHCWVTQRVQRHYRDLDETDRAACDDLIDGLGPNTLDALVKTDPLRWLGRQDNRLVLL